MTVEEPTATAQSDPSPKEDVVPTPETEGQGPDPNVPILKDLRILPPLQKEGTLKHDERKDSVALPPLRAEEPVSSIRAALSEIYGCAHLTNYRLVLDKAHDGAESPETAATGGAEWVISPYTGPNAVVSVPCAFKSLDEEPSLKSQQEQKDNFALDDYGDLTPLVEAGLSDGSYFRIVLERYDTASVRDHIVRLRSLFQGNAPSATSLAEEPPSGDDKLGSEPETPNGDIQKESKTDEKSEAAKEEGKEAGENGKPPMNLPVYDANKSVVVDGKNLKDFFYLVCGEDPTLYPFEPKPKLTEEEPKSGKVKKKGRGKSNKDDDEDDDKEDSRPFEEIMSEIIPRMNELEEKTRVKCTIHFSGFHPPPTSRRLMGDLAYLEVHLPGKDVVNITAVPTGFYVNRSSITNGSCNFDPSPAAEPCFSHELLDCLLQHSESLRNAWTEAVTVSKERAAMINKLNRDGPFTSLFRVAVRGDFDGYENAAVASASQGIDSLLQSPSWLVPVPRRLGGKDTTEKDTWNYCFLHEYNSHRTEEELSSTFGVDVRGGAVRDWNEELQSAREMPTSNLTERIERARVLHKVMTDFGEAAVLGVKAIADGHISSMNPNETARSQVFLHNNIFFSRAVDAGVETFKIAKGDRAARKSASRDVQCIGTLHRMEKPGIYTLATVIIDYLGSRFVCQSILPGILNGEKTHTLLYGAVEAGSPLMWDKEMHELLEKVLGKTTMVATRKLPREPLNAERTSEIQKIKAASPLFVDKKEETKESYGPTIDACAPIEAKGIRGSDQRKYVLDMTRMTPRDANWVPKSEGGTGKWEELMQGNGGNQKSHKFIPSTLDDDEWTLAVLRPELVSNFIQWCRVKWLSQRKLAEKNEKGDATKPADDKVDGNDAPEMNAADATPTPSTDEADKSEEKSQESKPTSNDDNAEASEKRSEGTEKKNEGTEKKNEGSNSKSKLSAEDLKYLDSLRLNVNVFLPDVRSLQGIDDEAAEEIKEDEKFVREAATHLWDVSIPKLTREIREGSGHQIPADGKKLTDLLHQHGINCRYLGRLALLAQEEERKDKQVREGLKHGNITKLERRIMPRFWLELLECEMIARSAKHVLDSYLAERGAAAAAQPAQTIASFLSAVVSEGEETAAQTETRLSKQSGSFNPDEDDFNALSICDTGGEGDAMPSPARSHREVWEDIEREIGRRFRYSLTLYNTGGKSNRALHVALLRRICQRTGVRLVAKNYELGGKCLCSGGSDSGGRMTASYPIAPVDIFDVVPLMKHSAAHSGGFAPCALSATGGLPPLHISLPDARAALEAAHMQCSARALSKALELAQEAASLYQRVTETAAHPGVVGCIDLMATILFDAGEPALAASSALKSLGLLVQIGGFDSGDVVGAHLLLSQMLLGSGRMDKGVKHLRAAIYLMEITCGSRFVELSNSYHKLGSVYHGVGDPATALRFYQESATREFSDRLLEGMVAKSTAMLLANLGQYKLGVETEKRAYRIFSLMLGEEHTLTKTSDQTLKKFMQLAVEQGNRLVADEKKRKEEEAADAIASQIEADEAAEEGEKKKKKQHKKKKGKK